MHAEIKQLISLAKASGELTKKQKEAILDKARLLGDDLEEVSMILESLDSNSQRTDTKHSDKPKKCPNCGTVITNVTMKCPECGYVFPQVVTNMVSTQLFQQLSNTRSSNRKKQIIESFPIPNSKAELLEFLLLSKPYLEGASGDFAKSYLQKYAECIGRCKLFFPHDEDFSGFIQDYERMTVQKRKAHNKKVFLISSFLIIAVLAVAAYFLLPPILSRMEESRRAKQYNSQVEQFYGHLEAGSIISAKEALQMTLVNSPTLTFEPVNSIVSCLDKEYCKTNPLKADSLLYWAFDLSLEERLTTREELWTIIQKVSDCHMGIGDTDGAFEILKVYAKRYPDDWNMIRYRQKSLIGMAIETGNLSAAKTYLTMAGKMFSGAPEDIKNAAMKELSDLIARAKDFVAFGYGFSAQDSVVMSVDKGSKAESLGVRVGDILVNRDVEEQIALRRQRAREGTLYHHEFKRNGEIFTVELPYEILPY